MKTFAIALLLVAVVAGCATAPVSDEEFIASLPSFNELLEEGRAWAEVTNSAWETESPEGEVVEEGDKKSVHLNLSLGCSHTIKVMIDRVGHGVGHEEEFELLVDFYIDRLRKEAFVAASPLFEQSGKFSRVLLRKGYKGRITDDESDPARR